MNEAGTRAELIDKQPKVLGILLCHVRGVFSVLMNLKVHTKQAVRTAIAVLLGFLSLLVRFQLSPLNKHPGKFNTVF
jgi:hypothetical protein